MKKYFFRAAILLLTFLVGVGITTPLLADLSSENTVEDIQRIQQEVSHELTFESWGPFACGTSLGLRANFTSEKASDGTILRITNLYAIKTKSIALKRFARELDQATRIIERTPNVDYWKKKTGERAVIEKDETFSVIRLGRNSSDDSNDFHISIITATSLRHLLEFEKQQKAYETSVSINSFKP